MPAHGGSRYAIHMKKSVDAREAQDFTESLRQALLAERDAMDDLVERATAAHSLLIAYRLLGRFDEANRAGNRAYEHAAAADDQKLMGDILADHGELLHDMALSAPNAWSHKQYLKRAYQLFNDSIWCHLRIDNKAGVARTRGFEGLMRFETATNPTGRKHGITQMLDALEELKQLDESVFVVNLTLRVMRASLIWRVRLFPEALKLTRKGTKSEGSRPKVFAVMLGNRTYKLGKSAVIAFRKWKG